MASMTRRDRLMTIYRGDAPDRSPIRLWGAEPGQELLHPAYEPVRDRAVALTDLVLHASSAFRLYGGAREDEFVTSTERPTDSPEWVEIVSTHHTPEGELTSVHTRSTCRKPGYDKEYLLKEPSDIRKLLSLPYEPFEFSAEQFNNAERELGDAGIVVFALDHAMYGLQRLIGSENLALWSVECPDLLLEAMTVFQGRIIDHARAAFEAGLKPVMGWAGPELCVPPLMGPRDFDRFVFDLDKPLMDLIHDRGGYVWIHSHGDMSLVLERFVEMGTDVLNPIEPPPVGRITLAEAFEMVGDRMGLEGAIETHDLMVGSPDLVRDRIRQSLEAGAGRRFILCPSTGYMEDVEPSERFISNMLLFVEEGVRYAEELAAS